MIVIWGLIGLFFTYLTIHFIVHPRKISDAHWYGSFTEYLYLYLFPPTFAFFALFGYLKIFDAIGVDILTKATLALIAFVTVLWFIGFIAMLGVPMPPFMTPKWIRERRKADREAKRQKREERRLRRTES